MVGLGDLPGGAFDSYASDVSDDGSVVVGGGTSESGPEAFRWTTGSGMVGLGDLPGGAFESQAIDVSDDGSVVVGSSYSASGYEAFCWTTGSGMFGLGDLPGGEFRSYAHAVNGDGSVVVGLGSESGNREAFRWTTETGMQSLWDVLLAYGVDPAADGWTSFYSADGISADGNTIVGWGGHNGNSVPFVAVIPVVPEPACLALLSLAVPTLFCRRHRG
jgi:probable HAF family extracellular repeat protein